MRSAPEALLTVRLVVRADRDRRGLDYWSGELAGGDPERVVELERGFAFVYADSVFGVVAGPEERRDYVYETRPCGDFDERRLLDRGGRVVSHDVVRRGLPAELVRALAERRVGALPALPPRAGVRAALLLRPGVSDARLPASARRAAQGRGAR